MSWSSVVFSLPSCHRFRSNTRILKLLSIMQSYVIFAFAFTILMQARTYGNSPGCNSNAVVVLFRPFPALNAGRIVGWIVTIIVVVIYTIMTCIDYLPPPPKYLLEWVRVPRESPGSDLQNNSVGPGGRENHDYPRNQANRKQQASNHSIFLHKLSISFISGVSGKI